MRDSILVVDGDADSQNQFQEILLDAGFEYWSVRDAEDARLQLEELRPILILLDWHETSITGLEFLYYIRRKVALLAIPVIMLSDRKNGAERIAALEAGADDFIDKPFSPGELVARIQALLRRYNNRLRGDILEAAGLRLELHNHAVFAGPTFTPLKVGRMAFGLLVFLVANSEVIYSRDELLVNVWGKNCGVNGRTVDVHIRHLRRSLSLSGHEKHLQTVRGCGYRFSMVVES